jgi:hypothetical protein
MRTKAILFILLFPLCSYSSDFIQKCEDETIQNYPAIAKGWELPQAAVHFPRNYLPRVADFCKCFQLSDGSEKASIACVAKSRMFEYMDI